MGLLEQEQELLVVQSLIEILGSGMFDSGNVHFYLSKPNEIHFWRKTNYSASS